MTGFLIEKGSKDKTVIDKIRAGIETVKSNGLPIRYLLVQNLVAQFLHEQGHTIETKDGYFLDDVKVINCAGIDLHEFYVLTDPK